MDAARKPEYRRRFDTDFHKHHRGQFQDFFARIMQRAHPGEFLRTGESGSRGDRGCDGFLRSTSTVFQVYAPSTIHGIGVLLGKVRTDFAKARSALSDMQRWVFVYNTQEIHIDVLTVARELQADSGVEVALWGFEELWQQVERIPDEYPDEALPCYVPSIAPTGAENETLGTVSPEGFHVASGRAGIEPSIAQRRVLLEQVDAQATQLRTYLDAQGQSLWDEVKSHLATLSFDRAIRAGQRLEQWLNDKGHSASPQLRGQTFILLGDLSVIETMDEGSRQEAHISKAHKHHDLARAAFGSAITVEDASRLVSRSAKLHAVGGDYEGALRDTEGVDAPGVISLRLAILIEQQRFEVAAEILRDRPLHERWADSAVIVFVASGAIDRAREVLVWARSKEDATYHRCLLHFAKSLVISVQKTLADDGQGVPGRLPDDMRDRLREVLTTLHPLVCAAESTDDVRDGIVAESLAIATTAAHRLGDFDARLRYTLLLGKAQPVALPFARAVQAGFVEAPHDVPDRLRRDHADSREASILAALIEGMRLGRPAEAIDAMRALVETSTTLDEKEALCGFLLELSGLAGRDEADEVDRFVEEQLGSEHRSVKLRRAMRLIWEREAAQAEGAVDELGDEQDPLWWQLRAKLEYLKRNKGAAADALAAACRLMPRPELIRSAIGLAEESDRDDLLEELLTLLMAVVAGLVVVDAAEAHQRRFAQRSQSISTPPPSQPSSP